MPHSKKTKPLIITPYKSLKGSFEKSLGYSKRTTTVKLANTIRRNQLYENFIKFRHFPFTQVAVGTIGALLAVKSFAFTYQIEFLSGIKNQSFDFKAKLG